MVVLTDCPDKAVDFAGSLGDWRTLSVDELDDADRRLWQSLSDAKTLWQKQVEPSVMRGGWSRIVVIGEASKSQFDALQHACNEGFVPAGPIACLALTGQDFHGQRGRDWAVVPGNLFLTVCMAPDDASARAWLPGLVALPAVAVVEAIEELRTGAPPAAIKWVNDIVLDSKKVGGVLAGSQCLGDKLQSIILGIGVNVEQAPTIAATPFVPAAACVQDVAPSATLVTFFWSVLAQLYGCYSQVSSQGPGWLIDAYRKKSNVLGRSVCLWPEDVDEHDRAGGRPPPLASGTVEGLADDLSLRLHGHQESFHRGRLAFDDLEDS